MNGGTVVEACATTPVEAGEASDAGAHRIELCSALETGGLTPSPDLLKAVRSIAGIPVFVMVRQHPGPFTVSHGDVRAMRNSMELLAASGADGFVLGVLDDRNRIDKKALDSLVKTAGSLPVTFHRAFDLLADPVSGLRTLMDAGVARILSSGGPGRAWAGRKTLRQIVAASSDGLTVMAGGGVRASHVVELVRTTGVREVHARASAIPAIMDALMKGAGRPKAAGPRSRKTI